MRTTAFEHRDTKGVFAVPPLARRPDERRTIDIEQNNRIVRHIAGGGIERLIYGGNAFLYHITLADYEQMLEWLSGQPSNLLCIPSVGPSFGRAIDQAALLRRYSFPLVMVLPCSDPRDAEGLEAGMREFADAAGCPLMLYLKEESSWGSDAKDGLGAVERLVRDKICLAIKYAVVRPDPNDDPYLTELLRRVPKEVVISGIGERPAVQHMHHWSLPGFTTGSGCVAPELSQAIFEACQRGDWSAAEALRAQFIPLENLRDEHGPARVLHAAVEREGIAVTGPIPPYVSPAPPSLDEAFTSALTSLKKELVSCSLTQQG